MKISILLPYKENFSSIKSGAVSLGVNDLLKCSTNKKKIFVFGHTKEKKYLDANYINLNFNKKFFNSNTKIYLNKFLEYEKKINSDIIEVHNRPSYVGQIKKFNSSKLILYFHNDPLFMNKSKTVKERQLLMRQVDHFIFNSYWSLNRFKINLHNFESYKNKFSVVYQSVNKPKINFNKKQKIISFIGKLNKAKGYDVFGNTITKILDKYPKWKAIIIGDEPREKIFFQHPRLINYGYKNHNFILDKLKMTSMSIICSRWDEPLGRASLEACSRGSVPIITNRGGLPETSKSALIIKKLDVENLYNSIKSLIENKEKLLKLQKDNYKNFKFIPRTILKKVETIRKNLIPVRKINIVNQNSKFKILHITNFNERHNGRLHYNTGRRINNGFIRNNHTVFALSDRDFVHNSKSINDVTGSNTFNSKIIKINDTFKPDLIVIGHADSIKEETFLELKNTNKNLKFAQWFLDPVSKNGPDYLKNKNRLVSKSKFMDCSFLTTSPDVLDFNVKNSFFIPNPSDASFETLKNYQENPENDLFFAMSHGVHRGVLKKGKLDNREIFLKKLVKISNKEIKYDFYGYNDRQPIWGEDFINTISNSKMGLNLSRGEPLKYYSSDRIAQLFGNGLLTFLDERTCLNELFNKKEAVFYKDVNDLSEKVYKYKKDNKKRKQISKNGKIKYMKYFNSDLVSQFIIDKTFDNKSKKNYIWIK